MTSTPTGNYADLLFSMSLSFNGKVRQLLSPENVHLISSYQEPPYGSILSWGTEPQTSILLWTARMLEHSIT